MKELTKGSILKSMILFSLPILLGNVFQQTYNLIDIIVVGQCLGNESVSAVGATSPVVSLLFNIINGLCTGFAISVSRFYGSRSYDKMRKVIAEMITFSAITTIILILLCTVLKTPLLHLLNIPDEIIGQAGDYLSVVVFGLIVTLIYNLEANILRAVGNSVVPLIILIISAVLNVGLDFLFLYPLDMGVTGAALATVIAQLISAVVCFIYLIKKCPYLKLKISDFRPEFSISLPLLGAGFGMALMYSIVDIGSIVLQNGINGLGTSLISAHVASRKIFGFTIMPFSAISATLVTFVSQNRGAGQFDRIRKGIKYSLLLGIAWSTIAIVIIYIFAEQLITLVISSSEPEILQPSVMYLRINVPFYYALTILLSLRCTLQGLGNSIFPIIASVIEMVWKIITVAFIIPSIGYIGVCISEPIIWVVSGILVSVITIKTLKKASITP